MKQIHTRLAGILKAAIVLSGCVTSPLAPTVPVAPGPDKSFDAFAADQAFCQQFSAAQKAQQQYDVLYAQCMSAHGNQVPGLSAAAEAPLSASTSATDPVASQAVELLRVSLQCKKAPETHDFLGFSAISSVRYDSHEYLGDAETFTTKKTTTELDSYTKNEYLDVETGSFKFSDISEV
jgi:hypothetical protein